MLLFICSGWRSCPSLYRAAPGPFEGMVCGENDSSLMSGVGSLNSHQTMGLWVTKTPLNKLRANNNVQQKGLVCLDPHQTNTLHLALLVQAKCLTQEDHSAQCGSLPGTQTDNLYIASHHIAHQATINVCHTEREKEDDQPLAPVAPWGLILSVLYVAVLWLSTGHRPAHSTAAFTFMAFYVFLAWIILVK